MAGGVFVLGVDFGTSNTVAMLRRPDGRVSPLLFDGTPVLPSAVCATRDGPLSVGGDALHHGRHQPDALELNPKRRIDDGSVLLGATEYQVTAVIGAVLERVCHEATRVAGRTPDALVLSHPAGWGPVRRLSLIDAAVSAGLPAPTFVAEPAAAARYFVSVLHGSVPAGAALMVYDLGAGTFDVSVLRATDGAVEILGSDGLGDVGGLDVDAVVVGWLRDRYDAATWARLDRPTTIEDRRLRHHLWSEARVAKEMLSRAPSVLVRPPLLDAEVPLTLAEFEGLVRPLIDRTVRTALGLARHCRVEVAQVLLVGGSSRIPLVATALHRALGVAPTVTEQPETVVAEGCVVVVATSDARVSPAEPNPTQALPAQREPRTAETAMARPTVELPAVTAELEVPVSVAVVAESLASSQAAPGRGSSGGRAGGSPRPPRQLRSPANATRETIDETVVHAPPPGRRPDGARRTAPAGRSSARLPIALLAVLVLLAGGAVVLFAYFGDAGLGAGSKDAATPSTRPTTPAPPFPSWPARYTDPLTAARGWSPTVEPIVKGECAFRNNRLEIDQQQVGIFRCPGRRDELTDFALRLDVYLIDGRSCAGIWFRRQAHENGKDSGYLLKVCPTEVTLGHHHADGRIADFERFTVPQIDGGVRTGVGLTVRGGEMAVYLNDKFLGRHTDGAYPDGRIALGIAVPAEVGTGQVGFSNLEMHVPPAATSSGPAGETGYGQSSAGA